MAGDGGSRAALGVVLVWTVGSLVASSGCRCGTLHAPPPDRPPDPPYDPLDPAQSPVLSRIRTDILGKLGLDAAATGRGGGGALPGPAANVTADERRRALRLYRQSVDQLHGKSHRLPGELTASAKQFFSFSALPSPGNRQIPLDAPDFVGDPGLQTKSVGSPISQRTLFRRVRFA